MKNKTNFPDLEYYTLSLFFLNSSLILFCINLLLWILLYLFFMHAVDFASLSVKSIIFNSICLLPHKDIYYLFKLNFKCKIIIISMCKLLFYFMKVIVYSKLANIYLFIYL